MSRMIQIEIDGVRARAIMHEDVAPKVCDAIWALLPLALTFRHTSFCGRQVFSPLEKENFLRLERESPQLFVHPGDFVYAFREDGIGRGPSSGALSEIALYYGRDARRWGARGHGMVRDLYMGSTIWATVVEGLDAIAHRLDLCRVGGGAVVTIGPVL